MRKDHRIVPEGMEEAAPAVMDITNFVNAVQTLGVLKDERWEKIIFPLLITHREEAARRSLMCRGEEAAEWRGAYLMAQRIINAFLSLRSRAAATVEEARKTRPV